MKAKSTDTEPLTSERAEIFFIPYEDKYIIYAPLKRLAFIGNKTLAILIAKLVKREDIRELSERFPEAVKFIEETGILAPDPLVAYEDSQSDYLPVQTTLFLTNRCNLRCIYCYASSGEYPPVDMPVPLARKAIDLVCDNAMNLGLTSFEIGFHGGGEPTLNWRTLKEAVLHARKKPVKAFISMSSNGCYTRNKLDFIIDYFDGISLSFDGLPEVQNLQRPLANGKPSFPVVMKTIEAFDKRDFPYGIRLTVTPLSVKKLPETIVFLTTHTKTRHIQAEPAFPRGRGKGLDIDASTADDFIEQFKSAYEIAVSRGVQFIYSGAMLDALSLMLCRAPREALIVLPTGDVSTCFEVHSKEHPLSQQLLIGRIGERLEIDKDKWKMIAFRTVEKISFCEDCFCKFHCAGDCLGKTFDCRSSNLFKPSIRCKINQELTKYLLIKKIARNKGLWIGKYEAMEVRRWIF